MPSSLREGDRERSLETQAPPTGLGEDANALEGALIAEDVSGEVGHPIPLNIKLDPTHKQKISSIQLVCAQGDLELSDDIHKYFLNTKDHVIDVTSWNLSNIKLISTNMNERSVNFTIVEIYNGGVSGQSHSSVKNIAVTFVGAASRAEDRAIANRKTDSSVQVQDGVPIENTTYQPVASTELETPPSEVFIAEVPPISPLRDGLNFEKETSQDPPSADDKNRTEVADLQVSNQVNSHSMQNSTTKEITTDLEVLLKRSRDLIHRGDISSARRLLEHARARARDTRDATYLLAQTYDPEKLRAWNVLGLRADPDLARDLYAKAAGQDRADERLISATNR